MTEESPGDNRAPEQAADLPSLPTRIAQVFFSPAALFDKLKAKPAWIAALVTVMVVSLVINAIIPEELIRQLVLEQLGDNPEPAQLDTAMRMAGIFRYIGPVVFTPILAVVLAGLILLIWNLILGGEASFAQTMSVSTHTLFIPTLGGLLTVPLMIASGDATVALSLDLLVPGLDEEGFIYRFLHGLNLFSIWAAVVLGIGVSRLYRKTSAGSAAFTLLFLYVVFRAVSAAIFG